MIAAWAWLAGLRQQDRVRKHRTSKLIEAQLLVYTTYPLIRGGFTITFQSTTVELLS